MPIFCWKCNKCGAKDRRLLNARPSLGACCCGGQLEFDSNLTSRIIEVRDNGIMPKRVEQLADVDELIRTRLPNKVDDDTV